MLSQKQLEIKNLVFLIIANLSGWAPWEADSSMKSNMQEAYWRVLLGSALQKGREGKGKEGKRTGQREK